MNYKDIVGTINGITTGAPGGSTQSLTGNFVNIRDSLRNLRKQYGYISETAPKDPSLGEKWIRVVSGLPAESYTWNGTYWIGPPTMLVSNASNNANNGALHGSPLADGMIGTYIHAVWVWFNATAPQDVANNRDIRWGWRSNTDTFTQEGSSVNTKDYSAGVYNKVYFDVNTAYLDDPSRMNLKNEVVVLGTPGAIDFGFVYWAAPMRTG